MNMFTVNGQLEPNIASIYLTSQEATELKVCKNCFYPMSILQITLTEAIRQCSNCSFSLSNVGKSSIEFIRRSYKDINKDPTEWALDVCPEEIEIKKLKSWLEKLNKKLVKWDESMPPENPPENFNHISGQSQDQEEAFQELEVALKEASLQNTRDDCDFPFCLDDLFGPTTPNTSVESPATQLVEQNGNSSCSGREFHSGFAIPLEASLGQPDDNLSMGISEMPNQETRIVQSDQFHASKKQSALVYSLVSKPAANNTSLDTSFKEDPTTQLDNQSKNEISKDQEDCDEVLLDCPMTSSDSSGLSSSSMSKHPQHPQEINSLAGDHRSEETPKLSSGGKSKCYAGAIPLRKSEQTLDFFSKELSSYSTTEDSYQLPELTRSDSSTFDVSFPDLLVGPSMPKVSDTSSRRYEKLTSSPSVENQASHPKLPFTSNQPQPSNSTLSIKVSFGGKELFVLDPNQNTRGEKSQPLCLSPASGTVPCPINRSLDKKLRTECESPVVNQSCEGALQKTKGVSCSVGSQNDNLRPAILITVPASEDISDEIPNPLLTDTSFNSIDLKMDDCSVKVPSLGFLECPGQESLKPVAEGANIKAFDLSYHEKRRASLSSNSSLSLDLKRTDLARSPLNDHFYSINKVITQSTPVKPENRKSKCKGTKIQTENVHENIVFRSSDSDDTEGINDVIMYSDSDDMEGTDDVIQCSNSGVTEQSTERDFLNASIEPYFIHENDNLELLEFSGAKFTPKSSSKPLKVPKKYCEILGEGKYVNMLRIIQKEVAEHEQLYHKTKVSRVILEQPPI